MRFRKTFSILLTLLMAISSLVNSSSATAVGPTAHVYLSDYTPIADQEITIYFDGLMPNTEYSYGYAMIAGNTLFITDPDFIDPINELGQITTDASGRATESLSWFYDVNEFNIYPGVLPQKIYVAELGSSPSTASEVIALSDQMVPGQNYEYGSVSITGSGVGLNGFIPGEQIQVELSGFGANFSAFDVLAFNSTDLDSGLDSWELGYSGAFINGQTAFGQGPLFSGQGTATVQIPDDYESDHLEISYYNTDYDTHAAGWIWVSHTGAIEETQEIYVGADTPKKIKPYSYITAVYGQDVNFEQIQLKKYDYCISAGDKIIFLATGICTWDILDSQGEVISSHRVTISKSALAQNSIPLVHHTVKYAKGESKISKQEKKKLVNLPDTEAWDELLVLGYAWKEGSKKQMDRISSARTREVVDLLEADQHEVHIYGGHGATAPLYLLGKKQSLNRRVEVVEIPAGIW